MRPILCFSLTILFGSALFAEETFKPVFVKAVHGLYVRAGPSSSEQSLTLMPDGALFLIGSSSRGVSTIDGKKGEWKSARFRNLVGFVFDGFTRPPSTDEQTAIDFFSMAGSVAAISSLDRDFYVNLKSGPGEIGQLARYGRRLACYYGAGQAGCALDGLLTDSTNSLLILATHTACRKWGDSAMGIGPCLQLYKGKFQCTLTSDGVLSVILKAKENTNYEAQCRVLEESTRDCSKNCWTE